MKGLKAITVLIILLFAYTSYAQELVKAGEKAEYEITLAGKDAGYVKFDISKGEKGILLFSSECKLILPTVTILFKSESKITPDLQFKELIIDADVSGMPNQSGTVTCSFKEDSAHVAVEGAQNIEKGFELKEDYLVLPDNVFEYYYLGLKKFLSLKKDKMVILSFVPNALITRKISLTKKEIEKVKLGKKEVEALHISMGVGPQLLDVWVNAKTKTMVKMNIAAQQFEVILKN